MNLDTDSVTTSLRVFAQSDRCPAELAAVILDPNRCSKHALPPSLRKAVEVNSELEEGASRAAPVVAGRDLDAASAGHFAG
jgi:hypothetical protein